MADYAYGDIIYGEFAYSRPSISIDEIFTYDVPLGYIQTATLSFSVSLNENTTGLVVSVCTDGSSWRSMSDEGTIIELQGQTIIADTTLYIKVHADTTNTNHPITINDVTPTIQTANMQHFAVTSAGDKYINGVSAPTADLSFITFNPSTHILTMGPRSYDELYVTPEVVSINKINYEWLRTGKPFADYRDVDLVNRPLVHSNGKLTAYGHDIFELESGLEKLVARYGINADGDLGITIYDDETGDEVAFAGKRFTGETVGFGSDTSNLVPNTRTVNGHALSADVTVTKGDVGLGNCDNTSDANKPVSSATQTALDLKANSSDVATSLALKANASDVTTSLALKADLVSPSFTTPSLGVAAATSINGISFGVPDNTLQLLNTVHERLTQPKLLLGFFNPLDGGTEKDYSIQGHDATYVAGLGWDSTDQSQVGNVYVGDFSSNKYMTIGDTDDLSFFSGTADVNFTVGAWIYVPAGVNSARTVIGKIDQTTATPLREWRLYLAATGKLQIQVWDNSANVAPSAASTNAVTAGWRFVVATYATSGGTGASFANGLNLYVDGLDATAVPANSGTYVAQENLGVLPSIGASKLSTGAYGNFYNDKIGCVFVSKETVTALNIWRMYLQTARFFGITV